MKLFVILLWLVGCSFTHGIESDVHLLPDAPSSDAAADGGPRLVLMTETSDGNVVPGDAVYCSTGTDAWFRAFRPSDFGATGTFHTTRIHFTSELTKSATAVTVAIYGYAGALGGPTLDPALMTEFSTVTGVVPDGNGPQDIWIVRALDVAAASAFVVEVSVPESSSSYLHLGADGAAETLPSYYQNAACGQATPAARPGHAMIIDVEGVY